MDWFEEWFDSPLYERLYANRDEDEAERLIDFIESDLELKKDAKILDLGCGRGRHAINLNRRGYKVKGIDLSEEAIRTAQSKAQKMNLKGVEFEVRDMRDPLDDVFDVILNLFTTFGYFKSDEENSSVFDSVVQMLGPEGNFVIDYLNASFVRDNYMPEEQGSFQNLNYNIHRYIKNDTIHKDIEFNGEGIDGRRTYSERVKLYDLEWFKKEMAKRNLLIQNVYGDYEGSPYDPKNSSRLLIISCLGCE